MVFYFLPYLDAIFFIIYLCSANAVPSTSGIVIYRDKYFYQNNLVDVFVYNNYLDKGASTAGNYGGYFIFIGMHGSRAYVPENAIIANLTNEEINPHELTLGNTYDSYLTTYLRILDLMKTNQNVAMVLTPLAEHIKTKLDRVKSGDIYCNEKWISHTKPVLTQLSNASVCINPTASSNHDLSTVLEEVLTRSKLMLGVQ